VGAAPRERKRALVIRTGALGDTLVALPAVEALAERYEVEVAGRRPAIDLLRGPKLATAVHASDRALFAPLFEASMDDVDLVRFLERFDIVVSWARLPLLAGKLGRLSIPLVESQPHPPAGAHASDHLLHSLRGLGVLSRPYACLDVSAENRVAAEKLAAYGLVAERFVAIHPSSGSLRKNWPVESFAELARLAHEDGLGVLWIEGDADEDVVRRACAAAPAPVAHGLPLLCLGAVLSRSAAFVGNDSGVSHLAGAAGARTLSIFRSTDPSQWAPRGPSVRVESAQASAMDIFRGLRNFIDTA